MPPLIGKPQGNEIMMNNSKIIRWGIIGCGDVAEHKSGPALYRTPGSELVAVMRRDPAKAQDFCARHKAKRWYTKVEDLLADPEVSAVYIASPHYLHKTHTVLAAEAGKAVLCEKPMGIKAAEAQAIVDACQARRVSLTVAYYRRFWQTTRVMRQLLDESAIGKLVQARFQISDWNVAGPGREWLNSREQSGGAALANTGSHWVDLIRFLLGEVQDVSGFCSSQTTGLDIDDTVSAELRLTSGVLVSLAVTLQSPAPINEIEIAGTEGRIFASPLSEGRLYLQRRAGEPELMQFQRTGVAHQELIEQVVESLRNNVASPLPGDEAVKNWRVIEAIYRSCTEGRRVPVSGSDNDL